MNRYEQVATAKPCCDAAKRARYTPRDGKPDLSGKCTCEHHAKPKVRLPKKYRGKPKITLVKSRRNLTA